VQRLGRLTSVKRIEVSPQYQPVNLESVDVMITKAELERATKIVDEGLALSRMACAPYSLEELVHMLQEGKNPLLGDKPTNKSVGSDE